MRRAVIGVVILVATAACSGAPGATATAGIGSSGGSACSAAISWKEATGHVGENGTVQGPVVSAVCATSSSGEPTFLNIGLDYRDPGRFTALIWGENRDPFPEPPEQAYAGKTVCVTGSIDEYQGVAEIIVDSPSQIQVET